MRIPIIITDDIEIVMLIFESVLKEATYLDRLFEILLINDDYLMILFGMVD